MEQKLDMLIEMVAGMKQDMTQMNHAMTKVKSEMSSVNKRLDVIEGHVANIDERLTQRRSVKKYRGHLGLRESLNSFFLF